LLDANVWLSGLLTRGVCERVLDLCWTPASSITIMCSEHLLAELAANAHAKFQVPVEEAAEAVAALRKRVELVEPLAVPADACRDPNDLPVLGAALAGQVACVVTGDRDLLEIKQYHGIPILSPREFYDRVRAGGYGAPT
jgi:putative PIN family toxin of toxin-antitoxin system